LQDRNRLRQVVVLKLIVIPLVFVLVLVINAIDDLFTDLLDPFGQPFVHPGKLLMKSLREMAKTLIRTFIDTRNFCFEAFRSPFQLRRCLHVDPLKTPCATCTFQLRQRLPLEALIS
jgi:hypothetical protein